MTTEENKKFMRRLVEETINLKNLEAIDEMVVEGFLEHVPFPGQGPGRDGASRKFIQKITMIGVTAG